jgi:hypothetical protein
MGPREGRRTIAHTGTRRHATPFARLPRHTHGTRTRNKVAKRRRHPRCPIRSPPATRQTVLVAGMVAGKEAWLAVWYGGRAIWGSRVAELNAGRAQSRRARWAAAYLRVGSPRAGLAADLTLRAVCGVVAVDRSPAARRANSLTSSSVWKHAAKIWWQTERRLALDRAVNAAGAGVDRRRGDTGIRRPGFRGTRFLRLDFWGRGIRRGPGIRAEPRADGAIQSGVRERTPIV